MGWKSKAQAKWGNSEAGYDALKSKVHKFNKETILEGLPDHVVKEKTRDSIIEKLTKHKEAK